MRPSESGSLRRKLLYNNTKVSLALRQAKVELEKNALEEENKALRNQLAASKQIFVQQSEGASSFVK